MKLFESCPYQKLDNHHVERSNNFLASRSLMLGHEHKDRQQTQAKDHVEVRKRRHLFSELTSLEIRLAIRTGKAALCWDSFCP
jgi:hypothetical protein